MRISNLFAFLVACFVLVSALSLIYNDATHAMQFSGWSLISYQDITKPSQKVLRTTHKQQLKMQR